MEVKEERVREIKDRAIKSRQTIGQHQKISCIIKAPERKEKHMGAEKYHQESCHPLSVLIIDIDSSRLFSIYINMHMYTHTHTHTLHIRVPAADKMFFPLLINCECFYMSMLICTYA